MTGQMTFPLMQDCSLMPPELTATPRGYKGLYAFHKYWGKKPYEPIAYIIDRLTSPGDLVLDPFVGSGTAAREALLHSRRFVGFDINPIAIQLTTLLTRPPLRRAIQAAAQQITLASKSEIQQSYLVSDGTTAATHYLWEGESLVKVWVSDGRRRRLEFDPTPHDRTTSDALAQYQTVHIRPPRFFSNSRINSAPTMTLNDLFTGRAQRNIDLLINAIHTCDSAVLPALKLCLTAASGQMTKMVFAVTGRGKTTGQRSDAIEVGSWVIGYWRPKLHFEVNVWHCFERRLKKLIAALEGDDPLTTTTFGQSIGDVLQRRADAFLACVDSCSAIRTIPNNTVDLIITDPPHSDRLPYLELSELWNSLLDSSPDFENEIIVSNAKERAKNYQAYTDSLQACLAHVPRVLTATGCLVLLFNARQRNAWDVLRVFLDTAASNNPTRLNFLGHFPCEYSARSVVQDNRQGALKHDLAIVFGRETTPTRLSALSRIPGWSPSLPPHLAELTTDDI